MKRFIGKVKTAAVSGALTALMATSAFQISAEEASTSFSTDIENNQGRVTAIERAGNTVPTTVTETGAGINGNDSLTDAAGGISTVINKGAQAAQEDLAKANKEINDLKNAIANANNVAEPTNQTETKRAVGYDTKVRRECVRTQKQSCTQYGDVTYIAKCQQIDTYINGTWVRSSFSRITSWRKYNFVDLSSYMSRPMCTGLNPIT
jgi:uncharacterized protein (UPF0335 family)